MVLQVGRYISVCRVLDRVGDRGGTIGGGAGQGVRLFCIGRN